MIDIWVLLGVMLELSALILLGFLAAFLQLLNRRRARRRARRTRERRGQA